MFRKALKSSSNKIEGRERIYTNLLLDISSTMLKEVNEDIFFNGVLAKIGECIRVSRAYIFSYDQKVWSNTHEWVAEGISPYKDILQNIPMDGMDEINSMLYTILRGEIYRIDDVNAIVDDITRKTLLTQGICSVLAVPMYFEGKVSGLFGFDICEEHMEWSIESINLIIAIGNLLSSATGHFNMRTALQAKSIQLKDILDTFPDPIYVSDMETYQVLFSNSSVQQFFPEEDVTHYICYKTFQGRSKPCEFCTNSFLKLDGQPLVWYHHNNVLNKDYKVIDRCIIWEHKRLARVSIAVDITDSLRIQKEETISREASIAKSAFLANMSHEIRTPLNGIIGLNHLAIKANTDFKVNDYLQKTNTAANTLLTIINEILDFSKIDAGKLELEISSFSFNEVVQSVQNIIQPNLSSKGLEFRIDIDPDIPEVLQGDSLRFSQIMFNLITNAIKFTEHGLVSMSIEIAEMTEQEITLKIKITDTGIGMYEQELDKLFVEFTQADNSTTRKYGGTGLGLTIAKRLIELMQGSIKVKSKPNQGTEFEFTVVFGKVEQIIEPVVEDNPSLNINLQGIKILLAEDNEINQEIAAEILTQQGCEVDIASDGLQAIAKVSRNHYDLILMDIQMPNMDGLTAARKIREFRSAGSLPIIAMTAHALNTDYDKSIEAGMQDHVTKPFSPVTLCETINRWWHLPKISK